MAFVVAQTRCLRIYHILSYLSPHAVHDDRDHLYRFQQFAVNAGAVFDTAQLVQNGSQLIAQGLVDFWVSLHHHRPA